VEFFLLHFETPYIHFICFSRCHGNLIYTVTRGILFGPLQQVIVGYIFIICRNRYQLLALVTRDLDIYALEEAVK
jgi:hypothetical protein